MYTHRYNASFLGFAPLQNPSVVIVVTVSGTTGLAGYGGAAAGPVFEKHMAARLRQEGVVRDVPEDLDVLIAKEKAAKGKDKNKDKAIEADDTALAELNPPTPGEMQQASGEYVDPAAPKTPNFVGKSMKDVMQQATATGLEVELFGDGLARGQTPPAGAVLQPGEHIAVRFAR